MTLLHTAVLYGRADPDLLDLLLSAGADIDARMIRGWTPLHVASFRPDPDDAAAILLRCGAAKDTIIRGGYSPLHFAAQRGHLSATRALLAAGADTTLRIDSPFQESPLDLASYYGRVDVVRELARHGVDLEASNAHGWTALHRAAFHNKTGVVDALIVAGAGVTSETLAHGLTPIFCAVHCLAVEAMQVLLRHESLVAVSRGDGASRRCGSLLHSEAKQGETKGASEAVDLLRWRADESELDRNGKIAAEVCGRYRPVSRPPPGGRI